MNHEWYNNFVDFIQLNNQNIYNEACEYADKIEELEDCEACYGQGYVHSNDEEGNDEIQKCDECEEFESDQDAREYYRDMGFPEFSYEEELFRREEDSDA